MSSIQDMPLHSSNIIKTYGAGFLVTRVSGGWIYTHQSGSTFVPYNNEFKEIDSD